MEPGEVAENQRQRMHGAMVEAVAAHGYGGTSVKQVISLAGVSRRAFYEQFSNKHECFLSTLELLASRAGERIGAAYRSTDGDIEDRMRAALQALTQLIVSNPKSAHMALVDAPAGGPAGWTKLTKTLLSFERMLFDSFARTPGATALPASVVRGIAGGLHMMTFTRVRQQRSQELLELVEEMLSWTLAFHPPAAGRLQPEIHLDRMSGSSASTTGLSNGRGGTTTGLGRQAVGIVQQPLGPYAERMRLLESALEMIALEGYGNLSPLGIADRARVSIDMFFSLFGDMEGCVLVALANLSAEVRETLSTADLSSYEEWPLAVRRALHSLMRHFAEHPSHAHMIATGAFEMGSPGIDLSLELATEVARTLTEKAPSSASSPLVEEGIAGAIWHTVYCHAACHKIERLPATADHLTYIALAPFLGAEQSVRILASERAPRSLSRLPERAQRGGERRGSPAALS
jgi:AcrR family transcriptional regulator